MHLSTACNCRSWEKERNARKFGRARRTGRRAVRSQVQKQSIGGFYFIFHRRRLTQDVVPARLCTAFSPPKDVCEPGVLISESRSSHWGMSQDENMARRASKACGDGDGKLASYGTMQEMRAFAK